jgi:hypothetical protein
VVTSWRSGGYERIYVTEDDFARFDIGEAVQVRVQEGLVGVPWVYGVYRE